MTTMRAGLTGWPITQSLSPVIHGAWIGAAGLDATYQPFPAMDESAFDAVIARGRQGEFLGLNVTAPFKERALQIADTATPVATRAGSANVLLFENGQVRADSVDGEGLLMALAGQAPLLHLAGAPVVVVGAGGAARAAVSALVDSGAEVAILNRTRSRAQALAGTLGARIAKPGDLERAAVIINAISGPSDLDVSQLADHAVVMDMGYRPRITPLLSRARDRGLTVVDGLGMLIGQARPSFRAFFGHDPAPINIRRVALAVLGEDG